MKKYITLSLLLLIGVFSVAAQQTIIDKKTFTLPVIDSVTGIYKLVNEMPDCPYNWQQFVRKHVEYPIAAEKYNIEGRVIIKIIIRKDGRVDNPEVLRSSGDKSLDDEAVRVVGELPKWIPGKQNGEPVDIYFLLPITFRLKG